MKIKYRNVVYETLNVSPNMVKAWIQQAFRSITIHGMQKTVYANYNLWEVSIVEAIKRLKKNNKRLVDFKFHNQKKTLIVDIDDSIAERSLDKLLPRWVTFEEVKQSFNKRFGKIRSLLQRKKKEKEVEDMYKNGLDDAKKKANGFDKSDIRSRQFFWFFADNMIDVELMKQIED